MHYAAKSIKDSLGSEVLGGNEVDEVLLAVFLLYGVRNYIDVYAFIPWKIARGSLSEGSRL